MVDLDYEGGDEYVFSNENEHDEDAAFLRGFEDEDEVDECVECGGAIRENRVRKVHKDESLEFCSPECADDYAESTI